MPSDHTIYFEEVRVGTGFRSTYYGDWKIEVEWSPRDGFDLDLSRVYSKDDVTGDWHRIDDDKDFNCITDAIKRELKSGKHDPDADEYRSGMRDGEAEAREEFRRAI